MAAFNAYSAISTAEYGFFQISSPPADPDLEPHDAVGHRGGRAQDFTGGAVALIEGAIAAGGLMPQPERVLFAQTVGQQNLEIGDTFSLANPALTADLQADLRHARLPPAPGHREPDRGQPG